MLRCPRLIIHNKVRMVLGDPGTPDPLSFMSGALNQASCIVSWGIFKNRTRARLTNGLTLSTCFKKRANHVPTLGRTQWFKGKTSRGNPNIFGNTHGTIRHLKCCWFRFGYFTCSVDESNTLNKLPGLRTKGARIHRNRATDRTRYACKKFGAAHLIFTGKPRHPSTGDTRLRHYCIFA